MSCSLSSWKIQSKEYFFSYNSYRYSWQEHRIRRQDSFREETMPSKMGHTHIHQLIELALSKIPYHTKKNVVTVFSPGSSSHYFRCFSQNWLHSSPLQPTRVTCSSSAPFGHFRRRWYVLWSPEIGRSQYDSSLPFFPDLLWFRKS